MAEVCRKNLHPSIWLESAQPCHGRPQDRAGTLSVLFLFVRQPRGLLTCQAWTHPVSDLPPALNSLVWERTNHVDAQEDVREGLRPPERSKLLSSDGKGQPFASSPLYSIARGAVLRTSGGRVLLQYFVLANDGCVCVLSCQAISVTRRSSTVPSGANQRLRRQTCGSYHMM